MRHIADADVQSVINHIKMHGPIEGENEKEVLSNLDNALGIGLQELEEIIDLLWRKGLLSKSRFAICSRVPGASRRCFSIMFVIQKKGSKPPTRHGITRNTKHVKRKDTCPPKRMRTREKVPEIEIELKDASRVDKLVTQAKGQYSPPPPQPLEPPKGRCSCKARVLRTNLFDMKDGTKQIKCKCRKCGRTWREGSG